MRATVWRCLRGASRSARKISSTTGLNGSNFDARGGSFFRGADHADAIAATTVRARREADDHSPWQRPTRRRAAFGSADDPAGRAAPSVQLGESSFG